MADNVNHPAHYNSTRVECIAIIEDLGLGFHVGNALKYIWRYQEKNGVEDLRKAVWYLNRYIDLAGAWQVEPPATTGSKGAEDIDARKNPG